MLVKEKSVGRADIVYQELKHNILDNTIKTGHPLTEELLAQSFNVSRTPIREALRMLVRDQLVVNTHNKGYIVRGINEKDMNEIFEVRAALEGWAAGEAAKKITDVNLSIIRRHLDDANNLFKEGDIDKSDKSSNEIHNVIIYVVDNYWLSKILKDLSAFTEMYRKLAAEQEGQIQNAHLQHERIYLALEKHDAQLAVDEMGYHLKSTQDTIQKALKDIPYNISLS